MSYTDRPIDQTTNRPIDYVAERPSILVPTEYHDRVRWGPILAGLVIALSTQLVLSALGAAIGLSGIAGSDAPRSNAGGVGTAVGIWSIISLFISLFIGGWVTTRSCGAMNKNTALLNGAILWATTLAISAWLLSSGVSGAFGVVASNAGSIINQAQQSGVGVPNANPANVPNVTAQQANEIAGNGAKFGWSFVLGSLLGLVAAMLGASSGARRPRTTTTVQP